MKIKNFIPSDSFKSNSGLHFNEMRNLKQVVALFGKNGSGKSRLLTNLPNEFAGKINLINHLNLQLSELAEYAQKNKLNVPQEERLNQLNESKLKFGDDIEFETGDSLISINSRFTKIATAENMNESEYRLDTLSLSLNPDFHNVKQNCAKFIKSLCKSEIAKEYHENVKNKEYYLSQKEILSKNIMLFQTLKTIVKEVMNKDLEYSVDEHLTPIVTLDKRWLRIDELSDGEKELLAYCTFLVLQSQDEIPNKSLSLKGKVLLIDEPELFLHPKAQIDLIKGLRNLVGTNGQIWIATHSISILSILDRDEIWLMENGNITSPSIETPNKVLTSLIGEDNVESLENFISSQYEWASIQFALECLSKPNVVSYKKDDAQQNQISEVLSSTVKQNKLLDFGAGKGRITQEIIRNPNLAASTYYQPLEIDPDHHSKLRELTSELQSKSNVEPFVVREVLNTHEKLNEKQYHCFFDYVLMVNVLHEIPLNKWLSVLNALLNSLKEDGHIIILEDQAIPRGENAHEYGFIIFNLEEFKILFSRDNPLESYKHDDSKYSERLTCVKIPKLGSKVTATTIEQSLQRKKSNCKTEIVKLREKETKSAKDGRLNGFYTQLYANVDMALSDLRVS